MVTDSATVANTQPEVASSTDSTTAPEAVRLQASDLLRQEVFDPANNDAGFNNEATPPVSEDNTRNRQQQDQAVPQTQLPSGFPEVTIEENGPREPIDGGYRYKDADGAEVTQWNNGARDIVTRDGNISKYDPNGQLWYHERQAPGGGRERFVREGNQWQRKAGDQVENIDYAEVRPDGTVYYGKENGRVAVDQRADGTRNISYLNRANGTNFERTLNADGSVSRMRAWPEGAAYEELQHDGSGWKLNDKEYVAVEVTTDGGYRYRTADGTVVTQNTDGTRVTDKSGTEENQRLDRLSEQYGAKHEPKMNPDGTVTHKYYVDDRNGNKIPILENNGDSYENVEAQLNKAREDRIADIESRYNVRIGRDGETSKNTTNNWELRTPRLDELYGLQSAFEKSQPSNLLSTQRTARGERLHVEFNKNNEDAIATGFYNSNYGPLISFDGPSEQQPGVSRYQDVEYVMMHELAHNGQFQRNAEMSRYWENLGESLGYEPKITNYMQIDGRKTDLWILKGKEPGERYAFLKNSTDRNSASGAWYRVDERGKPLGKDGQPVDVTDAERVPTETVMDRALVRPASGYFPNPIESGADATTYFRRGGDHRARVLTDSPEAYELAKNYDQQEINRSYGVKPDGSPKYVRGVDGKLIENNAENRDKIRQIAVWESEVAARRQ